jgi:hypothetical protein
MISFEDLCAALESFKARNGGQMNEMNAPRTTSPAPSSGAVAMPPPLDPPTREVAMPVLRNQQDMGEEEGTLAGGPAGMSVVYDDQSNELDIGDVLSDEEEK